MSKTYSYCSVQIENGGKRCKKQCNHCKTYFKPLELEHIKHRIPRKLKKLKYEVKLEIESLIKR